MRGNPLLQLSLITLLFAAAGFPVWKLTHASTPAALVNPADGPPPTPAAAAGAIEIRLGLAPPPADVRLSYLGQTVVEGHGPQAEFTGTAHATIPKEGADFALEAKWPVGAAPAPAAVHLTFKLSEDRTIERTVWATTSSPLVEILTISP